MYRRMFLVGQFYVVTFNLFYGELAEISQRRLLLDAQVPAIRDCPYETSAPDCLAGHCACVINDRIHATKQIIENEAARQKIEEDVYKLRQRFIGFANGLWFYDISSQVQARELFAIMMKQLGVETLYQELLAELERTENLERADGAVRAGRRRAEITVISTFFATLVIAVEVGDTVKLQTLWKSVPDDWAVFVTALICAIAVAAGWGAAVCLLSVLNRWSIKRSRREIVRIVKTLFNAFGGSR